MKKIVIASDFHLKYAGNIEDRIRYETVCKFLKSLINNCDILILNGDIFDLWIEWNSVIIKDYFAFIKILADLIENRTRIIYVSGNHDFWFGTFLSDTIGIELYHDFFGEEIDGKNYYVTHGDLHTVNDIRYQVFRKIVRSFVVKLIVKTIHPSISLYLGKLLSRSSRKRKEPIGLQNSKENGMISFAKVMLKSYDLIIMGHSHKPKVLSLPGGYYLNSGDWIIHMSYILIEGDKIELLYFDNKRTD
ncbi:MAG: UDP-2,3-diacylglucosamine diphosphatase [Candidatus Cloacimonadales bacterium]|nr:UDP-2,3-diacylglucosamine diphosphatase [Candidatus Cloacimonadota bacterium]MDD2650013.1 UDP-2,3-diacylglucosamine diphosphatase [Candidatus Cloacimonadota bacterium]MDD3500939.1 UDP-2,3-diacylglucosamine diphosphatase [Candidatus Cloacimonadota bacterium]MDX9977204.1 UDP-2,3-diacylglucosamine diphosphatase [Candidatus Cloacimonadales bacterium]